MEFIKKDGIEYLRYDEILMVFVKEDAHAVLEQIKDDYMPEHGEPVVTDLTDEEMHKVKKAMEYHVSYINEVLEDIIQDIVDGRKS